MAAVRWSVSPTSQTCPRTGRPIPWSATTGGTWHSRWADRAWPPVSDTDYSCTTSRKRLGEPALVPPTAACHGSAARGARRHDETTNTTLRTRPRSTYWLIPRSVGVSGQVSTVLTLAPPTDAIHRRDSQRRCRRVVVSSWSGRRPRPRRRRRDKAVGGRASGRGHRRIAGDGFGLGVEALEHRNQLGDGQQVVIPRVHIEQREPAAALGDSGVARDQLPEAAAVDVWHRSKIHHDLRTLL